MSQMNTLIPLHKSVTWPFPTMQSVENTPVVICILVLDYNTHRVQCMCSIVNITCNINTSSRKKVKKKLEKNLEKLQRKYKQNMLLLTIVHDYPLQYSSITRNVYIDGLCYFWLHFNMQLTCFYPSVFSFVLWQKLFVYISMNTTVCLFIRPFVCIEFLFFFCALISLSYTQLPSFICIKFHFFVLVLFSQHTHHLFISLYIKGCHPHHHVNRITKLQPKVLVHIVSLSLKFKLKLL